MIKHLIKYILLKWKWRGKVKFYFSSNIGRHSYFEGMNQIHPNATFSGHLGYGSYIAPHCEVEGKIGRFCSIAPYVKSNNGQHPYTYPYVATAPCFFSPNPTRTQNGWSFASEKCFDEFRFADKDRKYSIIIGNDVWIGESVFIAGGVTIGDGAVVLGNSVVTKDIPPFAIVGGQPGRVLRYRYSEEDIAFLNRIKWWNNPPEWFQKHWRLLNDIEKLKIYYETKNPDSKDPENIS